jgi:hypothetical protein
MKGHNNMDFFMAESGPEMTGEEEKKYMIVKENPWKDDIHDKMNDCKDCNNYHKLHKDHQIFCDQPGKPCDGKNYTLW